MSFSKYEKNISKAKEMQEKKKLITIVNVCVILLCLLNADATNEEKKKLLHLT